MNSFRTLYFILGLPFICFMVVMYGVTVGSVVNELQMPASLNFVGLSLALKSTIQAFASMLGAAILALFIGFALKIEWVRRYAKLLDLGLAVFYLMPTMVVVSIALWVLPNSMLFSGWTVVGVHIAWNWTWILHGILQERIHLPMRQREMAQVLGASKISIALEMEWPRVRTLFWVRCLEVYVLCFGSMGVIMLLGGGPPVETLETSIYTYVRTGAFDLQRAAQMACIQILFLLVPVLLLARLSPALKRQKQPNVLFKSSNKTPINWVFLGLFVLMCVYVVWTLFNDSQAASAVFYSTWAALGCAGVVALILLGANFWVLSFFGGNPGSVGARVAVFATYLPMVLSPLVLGLGFMLAFSRVDFFEGSVLAVALLHAALFWPYGWRLFAGLINDSQRWKRLEMAAILGASPLSAWIEMEWPRLKRPLLQSLALVCGLSLGEYSVASFFSGSQKIGLSSLIGQRMSQYRFEEATSLVFLIFGATVLLWFCAGLFRYAKE